jgi:hypothetical protein
MTEFENSGVGKSDAGKIAFLKLVVQQVRANTIYAMFVIELYNATWNFGPLTFENIVIEAQTTNLTWCTST